MENPNHMPVLTKAKPLTADELKDHVMLIKEVLMKVMTKGVHFDVIPGTDKETLLKPGAEKILTTFRIACMPEITDLSTADEIRYRVVARGVHQTTDIVVGAGVGECSSMEDKYAWRGVICDAEWDATPESRRREKWSKGWGPVPPTCVRQVRTNPSDLANTILKMAKKRAMVDLTLTATAASDVFSQDLDDMPPELLEIHKQRQAAAKAAPRSTASGNVQKQASEAQCRLLRKKLGAAGKTEDDLCAHFNVKTIEDMNMGQVNPAIDWIDGK